MEISKTTLVIGALLLAAIVFFAVNVTGDTNTASQAISTSGQFVGGGCGR